MEGHCSDPHDQVVDIERLDAPSANQENELVDQQRREANDEHPQNEVADNGAARN